MAIFFRCCSPGPDSEWAQSSNSDCARKSYQDPHEQRRPGSGEKLVTVSQMKMRLFCGQVDGEPWIQPAGDIVVLKSALKVRFDISQGMIRLSIVSSLAQLFVLSASDHFADI